jgi:UDP:flavonoid glycosyltransferase YjiC (YdhE family)
VRVGLQAWGSEGDIQPFTALAAALTARGHEVTLVVTDNERRDYGAIARRFGFRLIAVDNPLVATPEQVEELWRRIFAAGNPLLQAAIIMRFGLDPVAGAMYAASAELCATSDAVVGHFLAHPLRAAADKAGVPMGTLNVAHNCVPSAAICPPGLPDLGRWSYPLCWRLARFAVNRVFLPRINALRVRVGLKPDTDAMLQSWSAERLNLIAVSPQFCTPPADWEERHCVCGFLNPPAALGSDELPEGLDEFLSAGEPPVYLTFGSMMPHNLAYQQETAALWMDAVRRAGCRAVVQLPWPDLDAFPSPQGVFKVQRAPYRLVFPRCALVVHHGGAGTTQSALLSGRPSILVAHVSDQFFWGAELERLGAGGRTLKRRTLRAGQLAKGIRDVLARPELAARAAEIGAKMARENGVQRAVELIEARLLDNRPLRPNEPLPLE